MAIFVLLSLAAVAFLYYQNQQLKSMLATYQTQVSPTPTAIPDPTANWETYTNAQYNYGLKHPTTWKEIIDPKNEGREFTLKSSNNEFIHATVFTGAADSGKDDSYKKTFQLTENTHLLITYVECDGPGCGFGNLELPTFTQILSTFKFLENDKACTQEAKLCPDGSYVGRAGPDCEFAPCP